MNFELPKEHQLKYLTRRETDISDLRNSLMDDNFELAVAIGHRLKGSGQTFGFPIISQLGAAIEEAGTARDKDRISSAIEELALCIQNFLTNLES